MEARSPLGSLVLPGCGTSNHFPILCLLGLSLDHRGFFCNPHLSVSSSLTFVPYADILRGNKYIKGNMKIFPFFVFRDPVLSFLPPNHPLGPLGMEREKGCSLECLLWGGLWSQAKGQPQDRTERQPCWGSRGWSKQRAGDTDKGKCHSWRRTNETNRKKNMGVDDVNPESPLFCVGWGHFPKMGKRILACISYLLL